MRHHVTVCIYMMHKSVHTHARTNNTTQDALHLLKQRNLQLLVQGRELNAAKLEAQVR